MVVTARPVIWAMVLSVGLPEGFTPRLLRPADGKSSCDTEISPHPSLGGRCCEGKTTSDWGQ